MAGDVNAAVGGRKLTIIKTVERRVQQCQPNGL